MPDTPAFPSRSAALTGSEIGLFATAALRAGTAVARFEGPVVPWREVSPADVRHALLLGGDEWLVPRSEARYVNHSCAPNCRVDLARTVVTTQAVAAGEQLTIAYDRVTMAEWVEDPASFFWDDRWSFDCRCGAPACAGRIDRYRILRCEAPLPLAPATKLRIGPVPGRGRGVFATAPIAATEIFERAPVFVSPAGEWPDLERTTIFDYCFSWGPRLEHTAIGLGYASLYNHSYTPNAVYIRQLDDLLLHFVALRAIAVGEEITVNYNNDPANRAPLWFDVK